MAETKEESGIILKRYGKRPLAFLEELGYLDHPSVFAHGVELNEREIERLATSQVAIAHNPISNLKLASGLLHHPTSKAGSSSRNCDGFSCPQ